jgi:hypothetical protein
MNDNQAMQSHEWIELIEQEWGYRPVTCEVDARTRKVRAAFVQPIRVSGEMRIKGYTIVPGTFTTHNEHPFNAGRHSTTRHHSQAMLAIR